MKKAISILLVFMLLISFSGCKDINLNYIDIKDLDNANINFGTINYNNLGNYNSLDLNITKSGFLYTAQGFYDYFTAFEQGNQKYKLFEHNDTGFGDGYFYDCIPLNDEIYVTGYDDSNRVFYKFSLENKRFEELFKTSEEAFGEWIVFEDNIVYTQYHYKNRDMTELCVYNLDSGKTTSICDNVFDFSVVDNNVRYLTVIDTDTLGLYEYDAANNWVVKLSDIPLTITESYCIINFTTNYTVFAQCDKDNHKNIVVYSDEGSINKYTLPSEVCYLVAGENYAYALCYDYDDYGYEFIKSKANGIYKINLKNGSYEKVIDIDNEDGEIYVLSDRDVYFIQGDYDYIRSYQATVYKIDLDSKTKKQILTLK